MDIGRPSGSVIKEIDNEEYWKKTSLENTACKRSTIHLREKRDPTEGDGLAQIFN